MRYMFATIAAVLLLTAPALAGTRTGQLKLYSAKYGAHQEWVPIWNDTAFVRGDYKRSYFKLKFLANPAPGAANCFADVVYAEMPGCPDKWYVDDIEIVMLVEAKVTRCGRGWYAVSTPLDLHACGAPRLILPSWAGYPR